MAANNWCQTHWTKCALFIIILLWIITIILIYFKDDDLAIFQFSGLSDPLNMHNIHQNYSRSSNDNNQNVIQKESINKYPFLLKSMVNQLTGKTVTCNPLKYKYFRILLNAMHTYFDILNHTRIKTTTKDIDKEFDDWCHNHGIKFNRRQRIQIIDHKMYVSNHKYYKYGVDLEAYTTSILLYLKSLMQKYSKSIDNTDFIWHYHDVKVRSRFFKPYKWQNNGTIPMFFTDADVVWQDTNEIANILFGVSRNYMKYRNFGDTAYSDWKIHKDQLLKWHKNNRRGNIKNSLLGYPSFLRVEDYFDYKDTIANEQYTNLFNWTNKPMNKALFVGGASGNFRAKFMDIIFNDSYIHNLTKDYFDVVHQWFGFSVAEQLKYKYVIVLDGNSVRDGFFYQLGFNAVMLKQLTSVYEFWLFDLENNKHVIFFENLLHLISIVTNMIDQVNGYYVNTKINSDKSQIQFDYWRRNDIVQASDYNPEKLQQIAHNSRVFMDEFLNEESVDCFMINMLKVYNHYLFDVDSVKKSTTDCKMKKLILDD
eukprot:252261_1